MYAILIISSFDEGKDFWFILCDISKAFNKVWHKGLLSKLKTYAISGNTLGWIRNFLCDRQQNVVIDGFSSNHDTGNASVPRGSVLRPFLFLLYINDICDDLVNDIRGVIKKFVDWRRKTCCWRHFLICYCWEWYHKCNTITY